MFLNQLSTPLQKALFLELAILVMMASHDDDASEQMAKYSSDAVLSKFLASISTKEAEMLEEYQKEVFTNTMYQDFDFLEKTFSEDIDAFNEYLGDAYSYSYSSADRFPTLRVVLKTVIDEVLAQYGNNPRG